MGLSGEVLVPLSWLLLAGISRETPVGRHRFFSQGTAAAAASQV